MALTATQKVNVAEITRETYATVDSLASSLNASQETVIIADLATWATIRDSHVQLEGEVDFDNERKRNAIRERTRKALGLPLYSAEMYSGSGSVVTTGVF